MYFSVPPLFVIEFLHRVMDILEDYFGECNESIIKENYVIVYEVRLKLFTGGKDLRENKRRIVLVNLIQRISYVIHISFTSFCFILLLNYWTVFQSIIAELKVFRITDCRTIICI